MATGGRSFCLTVRILRCFHAESPAESLREFSSFDFSYFPGDYRSAKQGNKVAQCELGELLRDGKITTKDYVMAYVWSNLAPSHREVNAKNNIGIIEKLMTTG
jgi:TPR repeat protein